MNTKHINRVVIFGKPGSGKSTLAHWLSVTRRLPLYHIDKFFFEKHWQEREPSLFRQELNRIIESPQWIIDGNNTRSIESRWSQADLVIYLNFSRIVCLWRLIKRRLFPNHHIDDRAEGCPEIIRWILLKYLWQFDSRASNTIIELSRRYPTVTFLEIHNNQALKRLKHLLSGQNQ